MEVTMYPTGKPGIVQGIGAICPTCGKRIEAGESYRIADFGDGGLSEHTVCGNHRTGNDRSNALGDILDAITTTNNQAAE